jgi:putative polyhydroxyalkanoate system protein
MPNLTISIPHDLGREEARRRVQQQVDELRRQGGSLLSNFEDCWTGDRLDFTAGALGQTLTGQAFVEVRAVRLEIALPWILSMLAGTVKQRIEQRGHDLLGHK